MEEIWESLGGDPFTATGGGAVADFCPAATHAFFKKLLVDEAITFFSGFYVYVICKA
jgi:hypothetical protein